MNGKIIEIRDRATFIPVLAVRMRSEAPVENYYLGRAGFPWNSGMVMVSRLDNGKGQVDPYEWGANPRTMEAAHLYIQSNYDQLQSGDVVDVEFVLKEKDKPKMSERYDASQVQSWTM